MRPLVSLRDETSGSTHVALDILCKITSHTVLIRASKFLFDTLSLIKRCSILWVNQIHKTGLILVNRSLEYPGTCSHYSRLVVILLDWIISLNSHCSFQLCRCYVQRKNFSTYLNIRMISIVTYGTSNFSINWNIRQKCVSNCIIVDEYRTRSCEEFIVSEIQRGGWVLCSSEIASIERFITHCTTRYLGRHPGTLCGRMERL